MPIKSLMTPLEHASAGLPRVGGIHKGGPKRKKKKGDREIEIFGEDLDHFRLTLEPGYENYADVLQQIYGEKPDNLLVMVNGDKASDGWDAWHEDYGPSGTAQDKGAITLLRRCDGDEMHLWYDTISGYHRDWRKGCENKICGCKPVGRLNVLLPEFSMHTGVLGYFTLQTHSQIDIRLIHARLVSAEVTFQGLRGVQFRLFRQLTDLNVPEVRDGKRTGKKMTTKKHMLEMLVQPSFVKANLLPMLNYHREALPESTGEVVDMPDTETVRAQLAGDRRRIGSNEPAKKLPAQAGRSSGEDTGADLRIEENARRWLEGWSARGLTREEALIALGGLAGITLWKYGSIAADRAVDDYLQRLKMEAGIEAPENG